MEPKPTQGEKGREPQLEKLLQRALLLDLEVSPRGKILKIGAVAGEVTWHCGGGYSTRRALDELAQLAVHARLVIGHNLVRHDLRVLREIAPLHPLLDLPVLDTLALSPIAFPENPYHRLVKDYKLIRESVNDPLADARQAAVLLGDEFRSLAGLRQTEPSLYELLFFLLTTPDGKSDPLAEGLARFFQAVGGTRPTVIRAMEFSRQLVSQWACSSVPLDQSWIQTAAQRHALAYVVTWLRVSGSTSVIPRWVRCEFSEVKRRIAQLRETPCASATCAYCRRVHNAREQLRSFFHWEDFRPLPSNPQGGSLQQSIVEAGLRDESLLAILPTGGGKSLGFQLPALARNYRRGALTIVISPLQALMKDQVDGLARRTGTEFAAALYGLLTPPERGDVLRRIRQGDIALLYVSPEQLRNRSFRDAIAQREIGCWVFDEAHCLSKWGHDFRPDYLYAGRFIREFSRTQGVDLPPIACFTATAKQDVKEEIIHFFQTETGRALTLYEGGVERDNLCFEVQTVTAPAKLERVHDLLSLRLAGDGSGSAIVFRARRAATEEVAEYLRAKGWPAAHFHAGLTPLEKKQIQDDFLAGTVRVICATNAFGMGIDKDNVRLVIHADTPGSLENYLQEAGRAGRDGQIAECILLYNEEDCEQQFRLGAFSELSRRDIAQILRGLRKAAHGHREEVVITAGEILRDEDVDTDIDLRDTQADTRVRAAISWLERAGFVERNENVTSVFQARLLVRNLEEATLKMRPLNLSANEQTLWLAILREFLNAEPTDHITVDQLALLPEFLGYLQPSTRAADSAQNGCREPAIAYGRPASPEYLSARILKILHSMAQVGLMKRDLLLNAFVRHQVTDHSRQRLDRLLVIDRKLVDILSTEAPDPEGWMPLSLGLVNQRLIEEGLDSSTEIVRRLLKSLSEDGRGFAGTHGSLDLLYVSHDAYRIRVRRPWAALSELAEKRRGVASVVLNVILAKIPAHAPASADLLVEFSFDELRLAVENDLCLRAELKDIDSALERALMYLHEQRVIALQQGLAVFRSAMTIRLAPEARGKKYTAQNYQPLQHHYQERIFQVHVMGEYARRGLERIREALGLVLAYFNLEKQEFIKKFLGPKPDLLLHATTAQSFQRIVTDLANPAQEKVVTAPLGRNLLILAGPGSGKTRTVVHRCAYLLRVCRVRPRGILVCCFNRQAALELRRRLADLVGADARGVTILTYHSLAMRLLGFSYTGLANPGKTAPDFDALILDAIQLLRGEKTPAGLEPDEVRDRLLAGFQYILVDEYQDIDQPQYDLISALAGRTAEDADRQLSILAVGDDDQSIYGFRGANVEFIRRFQRDYQAEVHYLIENYRSTRNIIDAANQLIAVNRDRMKTDQPIRIDRHRKDQPSGGPFQNTDAVAHGRVQVIRVPVGTRPAPAVLAEIQRLRNLGVPSWSDIAVLARSHRDLAGVRTFGERAGIPLRWWPERGRMPALHHIREIHRFLGKLRDQRNDLVRASTLADLARTLAEPQPANPWSQFLQRLLEEWRAESDDAELPVPLALEFIHGACAESRQDFSYGDGVILSTIHAAKGTEHDHVLLLGSWPLESTLAAQEEARRTFYVGLTRARQTLAVFEPCVERSTLADVFAGPAIWRYQLPTVPEESGIPELTYAVLGLEEIHLGYPGLFETNHPIHAALRKLQPGAILRMENDHEYLGLFTEQDLCVAHLSQKAKATWQSRLAAVRAVRVLAMIHRSATQDPEEERRNHYRVPEWEIPLVEVVWEESGLSKNPQ